MSKKSSIDEKLFRHRLFWEGKSFNRPMIGALIRPFIFPSMISAKPGEIIQPESIDKNSFLSFYENEFATSKLLFGDLLYVATPLSGDPWGLPWMEGIMGAQIVRSGNHAWAKPIITDWSLLDQLGKIEHNPWYRKLLELLGELARLSEERFPVGTCLMRGPADIAQALCGTEQMGLSIIEHPKELNKLLDSCANAWISTAKAQLDLIPKYRDGYCSGLLPIWAPGTTLVTQEDESFFFSPHRYQEMLFDIDLRIVRSFDFPIYHVHSSYTHT